MDSLEENLFDQKADRKLRTLERVLESFDPDEVDAELAGDVLTITVKNKEKIIINRHRAARQIWMAAARQAWHFDEDLVSGLWKTEKSSEELTTTLEHVLSKALGRTIHISRQ